MLQLCPQYYSFCQNWYCRWLERTFRCPGDGQVYPYLQTSLCHLQRSEYRPVYLGAIVGIHAHFTASWEISTPMFIEGNNPEVNRKGQKWFQSFLRACVLFAFRPRRISSTSIADRSPDRSRRRHHGDPSQRRKQVQIDGNDRKQLNKQAGNPKTEGIGVQESLQSGADPGRSPAPVAVLGTVRSDFYIV